MDLFRAYLDAEVITIVNADELEQKTAESLNSLPNASTTQAAAAEPRSGTSLLIWVALLLGLSALIIAGWIAWQGQRTQLQAAQWQAQQQQYQNELQRLKDELAAVETSARQQSSELGGDLQRRLQAVEADTTASADFRSESAAWTRAAQAALEDSQARLNTVDERLRTLSARSAEADAELELDEIDYLLRMAQERLQLFGDTRNADRALQLADQQVLAFDNPMFIGLRREIAAARQALAATDQVDIVALGAELDRLQDGLATLSFRSSSDDVESVAETTSATGAELPWWEKIKNVLAGLVTVRRIDNAELAMPALADQQALRQRAWLQLEQARLAALSREQTLYQESLSQAHATVNRWFAADDAEVQQVLNSLQALQQRDVDPPMPDISGPWTTLRSLRDAGLSPAATAIPDTNSPSTQESAIETETPAETESPNEAASAPESPAATADDEPEIESSAEGQQAERAVPATDPQPEGDT